MGGAGNSKDLWLFLASFRSFRDLLKQRGVRRLLYLQVTLPLVRQKRVANGTISISARMFMGFGQADMALSWGYNMECKTALRC